MNHENTESSGGTRFSSGKPSMWWALPWAGLRAIVRVVEYGASKYAPFDWDEGQSYSTLLDCTARHFERVMTHGLYSQDDESGQLHLAHMAWNVLCLLHFIAEDRYELDDVTHWRGVTTGEQPNYDWHREQAAAMTNMCVPIDE